MKGSILAIFLFLQTLVFGQAALKLGAFLGETPLRTDGKQAFALPNGDTATITMLKFYASNIELWEAGRRVFSEENSFHLVDFSNENSRRIDLKNAPMGFDEVRFDLGIDSLTNVSGAFGGDLDPVRGMYWTWQSGYINFKMEGRSRFCAARKHEFAFHLGGYDGPANCLQKVVLKTSGARGLVEIAFDAAVFLGEIELKTTHSIMSPGAEAVGLAGLAARSFIILGK